MEIKSDYNGKHDGNKWTPLIIAAIGAAIGSLGTVTVVFNTPYGQAVARPDPFTGTQATALTQIVEHIEEDITDHITAHPDQTNRFDRRIATLEAQYAIVLANQGRILDRIDKALAN